MGTFISAVLQTFWYLLISSRALIPEWYLHLWHTAGPPLMEAAWHQAWFLLLLACDQLFSPGMSLPYCFIPNAWRISVVCIIISWKWREGSGLTFFLLLDICRLPSPSEGVDSWSSEDGSVLWSSEEGEGSHIVLLGAFPPPHPPPFCTSSAHPYFLRVGVEQWLTAYFSFLLSLMHLLNKACPFL